MNRLPERLRRPFILCYLEGKTNEEAARQLGCPAGTIFSRLARGREMLRRRILVCHSLNAHRVVRLTPPAILTEMEVEQLLDAIREAGLALSRRWPQP